ncbi:MerR family transcriptional regulator [Ascidiaceihabitans sp.]|uniref:MerR family transcriptional regulator n=1 Tax=Ascidiaceihabitans sp. TaxID=1872644 RepID=UPI0032997B88
MSKSADAFRTISEVADWLGVQTHVLRFWESKFTQVKPVKRAGGRRYYRPVDMLLLGGIRKLLHDDGLTIKGVQKVLREKGIAHVSAMSSSLDEASAAIPADVPLKRHSLTTPKNMQDANDTSTLDLFDNGAQPNTDVTITKFASPVDVQPKAPEDAPRPSFTQDAVVMPEAAPSASQQPQATSPVAPPPPPVPQQPQTVEPSQVVPDDEASAQDEPPQDEPTQNEPTQDDPPPEDTALVSDAADEVIADTSSSADNGSDDTADVPMPAPEMQTTPAEPTATSSPEADVVGDGDGDGDGDGADISETVQADTEMVEPVASESDVPEVMFKASAPSAPAPSAPDPSEPAPSEPELTPDTADDTPVSDPMPQMPAFVRRTSPLSPPPDADETQSTQMQAPEAAQPNPDAQTEADEQPEADVPVDASDAAVTTDPVEDIAPTPAPVLKPNIIDVPDTPPDSEFPAHPAMLTALTTAKSASPEATALLSQLAALRDRMTAAHKE